MRSALFGWGSLAGAAVLGIVLVFAFHVPQAYSALVQRQAEIRELQRKNAELSQKNEERRQRIRELQDSAALQELEVRKRMKKLRPDEHTFILQGEK